MQFYTLQQASADLAQVIANTVRDQDEAVIVSESGAVVLLSQEQFASMQETLRLLSDRCSLNALLAEHAQRDAGHRPMTYKVRILENAQQDLDWLHRNDKTSYIKCFDLVREVMIDPRNGTGKPERLRYFDKEAYSRRVNYKDRLIYMIYESV